MSIDKISVQNLAGKTLVRVTADYRVLIATTLAPTDARFALEQLGQGMANMYAGITRLLEDIVGDRLATPDCYCAGCKAARFLEILRDPKLH